MTGIEIKRNERDWAGQLVSWIKSAIERKSTVFQDVTNDTGVKTASGRTRFPDILLFIDKTSGIIFNGWELKFPDTAVDDVSMLENALEKAQKLHSDSFVTWNGAEAVIWRINDETYSIGHKTIPEACAGHSPYWYSLKPKGAHIITTLNPYERFFFAFSQTPVIIDQRLIAMQVQEGYDVELVAALLNSVITFIILEMKGTPRNLGVLDLNADYLKQICLPNPDLLSPEQCVQIKQAFQPLKHRKIDSIFEEIRHPDRIAFDKVVFNCFGLDHSLLESIYSLLTDSVSNRITLKKK